MKTGNAAAFPVLPGSGPAVLQYGFRDLGVSGFAGIRGAARPPDGVKGQSAPCRRRHPRVAVESALRHRAACRRGHPFRPEGLGCKRGALIHGLYQSEGLVPCKK